MNILYLNAMITQVLYDGLLLTLLAFSPPVGVKCFRQGSGDHRTRVVQHTAAVEVMWGTHSGMVLPSCDPGPHRRAYQRLSSHFCHTANMADCEAASHTAQVHFNTGPRSRDALEVVQDEFAITGGRRTRKTAEMHPMCAWTIVDDLRAVYDEEKRYRTSPMLLKKKRKRTFVSLGRKEFIRSKWFKLYGPAQMKDILQKTPRIAICWTFTSDYVEVASHYEKYASDLNCSMTEKDCCLEIRNRRQAEASDNFYFSHCPAARRQSA
eukprot:TRINITY_DN10349_c0_g1_i1.p1 TRINITY_DN10349_c0_g1~~TRINITY_DN10349_c0_g1_i1.p1  ORF type:complete len:266 (+),score=23.64 TRINITY_DN10349_c0_g1_i1:121-918(+)